MLLPAGWPSQSYRPSTSLDIDNRKRTEFFSPWNCTPMTAKGFICRRFPLGNWCYFWLDAASANLLDRFYGNDAVKPGMNPWDRSQKVLAPLIGLGKKLPYGTCPWAAGPSLWTFWALLIPCQVRCWASPVFEFKATPRPFVGTPSYVGSFVTNPHQWLKN